jgi:hypothetical protein
MLCRVATMSLLLSGILVAQTAFGCSCVLNNNDAATVAAADYVFVARLVSAREVREGSPRIEASFVPLDVVKGNPKTLPQIWTYIPFGPDSNSCAVSFAVGEHYVLIIASDGLVHHCSRSRRFNPALDTELLRTLHELVRTKAP